jgi:hypothetical protein
MANPYKKADQKPKAAPGGQRPVAPAVKEAPVVEESVVIPEVEVPAQETPVMKKPAEAAPATKPVAQKTEKKDPFAGMVEEKPRGKSYGFYLDEEVVDALEKLAKQKKISKSKVLNTILRNILLEG